MAMTRPQPISILLVASTAAAFHAGAAVLFTPVLSFLMLFWGASPHFFRSSIAGINDGMVFAVTLPLLAGAVGFVGGGLIALGHNLLAESHRRDAIAFKAARQSRAAAMEEAA